MSKPLVVDAMDDEAVAFYRHHGFIVFESASNRLYMPLVAAEKRLQHEE